MLFPLMTQLNQIWKCEICGNIVEILHQGADSLVCCGQPMKLQTPKQQDEGKEKHLPVIQGKLVKVGTIPHPMLEEHFIEWIEASNDKEKAKIFLKPTDSPQAEFCFTPSLARIYCNVHGLWAS